MSEPIRDRIEVTFAMTADDYARYFAARGRQESGWTNVLTYALGLFSAIPVALMFRSVGARPSGGPAAGDLIGQFSLASFLLGTVAMVVAGYFVCHVAIKKYLAGTPNAFESKTAVLDRTGVCAGDVAMGRREPVHQRKGIAPDLDRAVGDGGHSAPEFRK